MDYVTRIHLNPECGNREELIEFCLNNQEEQYLAIGWSIVYKQKNCPEIEPLKFENYQQFYDAIRKNSKHMNHVVNNFKDAKVNDLYWTRDKQGFYWICRVKSNAFPYYNEKQDIGALLPVKAYKYGTDVPGQIKSLFCRPNGGTASRLRDQLIIEFSKRAYNELSCKKEYKECNVFKEDWLSNLPHFDLEELVITYIQINYDLYVLSNSIANKSTTIAVECEFMSRKKGDKERAVVQVKASHSKIDADDYKAFLEKGYKVFLYAKDVTNTKNNENIIVITREQLLKFYMEYKGNLPNSITKWEDILNLSVNTD